MESHLARTFAALSATNEAILYATSPEELYGKVCEAAFSSGDFLSAAAFLLDPATSLLRFAAGRGESIEALRPLEIPVVAGTAEAAGVCGRAFRDQKLCVSNDYQNDPKTQVWRTKVRHDIGSAAALPLVCKGQSIGVLLVMRRDSGALTGRLAELLERMSENVSFALENFEREKERARILAAKERLAHMFA